jgi:hypothetical protein
MTDIKCLAVPREHLEAVWPIVRPMLEKAVKTAAGKMDIDDVLAGAQGGLYVVWLILVDGEAIASVTTRIIDYPKCKAMALDWVGGTRMKEWFGPSMRVMKDHAIRNGCAHMEGYGREAWMRWIGKEGWRPDYVTFKMELDDGQ